MYSLDLNGSWRLGWCEPGEGEEAGWQKGVPLEKSIRAAVPGDVHIDLIEAGVIDEPLNSMNSKDCQWMNEKDWWYTRQFHVSRADLGEYTELHFEGLDTTADIYLNGRRLGSADNMNVAHDFAVGGRLREGVNTLSVRLDIGVRKWKDARHEPYNMWGPAKNWPRYWVRKAAFTFGWDWAKCLPTCGIWRGVELRSWSGAALRDLCLRTKLGADGSARVDVIAEVMGLQDKGARDLVLEVSMSCNGHTRTTLIDNTVGPGNNTLRGRINIPEPELWWPAGYGEQPLYDVSALLTCEGDEVDSAAFRYGLREIAVIQEPMVDDEGESFIFEVNGEPIFCKGANWIPADSIIARVSPAKYDALISAAAEANFNMLRIWAGGIFEDDVFYELCDEKGILIWQDFLFSCLYYPDDDPEFVQRMQAEAEFAVRRLRNHPCLALWCGNNENQWIHQDRVAAGTAADRCYGERIYDQVLPDVCERLDPTRPYWPSSPYGTDEYCNSESSGDRHAWQVTILDEDLDRRLDYRRYAEDTASFVSEYGIAAPPDLDSWQRCLKPEELEYASDAWNWHRNSLEWRTQVADGLERYWKPADELSLEEYIRAGQMIQAEALKFSIEHWRRRKFKTAGVLFWMYNDCWCETGWTIIDYYLNRKASFWSVKRAFAPLMVSPQDEGGRIAWHVVNDRRERVRGRLQMGWANVRSGELIELDPVDIHAPANAAGQVAYADVPDEGDREAWVAWARLEQDGEVVGRNRCLLADFRFNEAGFAPVQLDWTVDEAAPAVSITADAYAFHVHIDAPRGLVPADNDFDLLPGETRTVPLCGPVDLAERMSVSALNGA